MQEVSTYANMARLINIVPSCLLVFIGAWVSPIYNIQCTLTPFRPGLSAVRDLCKGFLSDQLNTLQYLRQYEAVRPG